MTFVSCTNIDCRYCDSSDFHCTKSSISVGDGFDSGCDDLEPYYNSAEYENKYYKCVKTKNDELGRCVCYGKRIEYNGRVFYTSDRITEDGAYKLTDAKTGYNAGEYSKLEQRFDKLCELAKKIPKVVSLPLVEWDNGGYVIVEGTADER